MTVTLSLLAVYALLFFPPRLPAALRHPLSKTINHTLDDIYEHHSDGLTVAVFVFCYAVFAAVLVIPPIVLFINGFPLGLSLLSGPLSIALFTLRLRRTYKLNLHLASDSHAEDLYPH